MATSVDQPHLHLDHSSIPTASHPAIHFSEQTPHKQPLFDSHASSSSSFPSVQELSLTLSADIEIHRLWKTITEILSQNFHATRITLCLPQDPTVPSSSIESSLHNSRPWGLKAHWDSKRHFLDENTVTPRDEFAHHHHRLHKSSSVSSDSSQLQNVRSTGSVSSISLPLSSTPSVTSSTHSSSFSRRREGNVNNSRLSINLGNQSNSLYGSSIRSTSTSSTSSSRGYTVGSGVDMAVIGDGRTSLEIQDRREDYNEDYWNTNAPHDGGYSSSTSSISSYSSTGSAPIGQGALGHTGFSLHPRGTECFAHLQSLEYDPEPLLNEHTISSILRAGKTVVLTREYNGPAKRRRGNNKGGGFRPFRGKGTRHGASLGMTDDEDSTYTDTDAVEDTGDVDVDESDDLGHGHLGAGERSALGQDAGSDIDSEGSYFPPVESSAPPSQASQPSAGFADFVQGLNPTWSQSPAPSPNIIKEDPTINPFFFQPLVSYPSMDDDAFDPPDQASESNEEGHSSASEQPTAPRMRRSTATAYIAPMRTPTQQHPPALANARSLIHVPLYHSTDHFNHRHLPSDIRRHRPPVMPVGIISFLSDQIPYPPKALDIFTDLNPFLANQITSALRLEDMIARSKRWGVSGASVLGDGPRTNETFAESIQRKMKDNHDTRTTKPSIPHPNVMYEYSNYRQNNGEARTKAAYTRKSAVNDSSTESMNHGTQRHSVAKDTGSTATIASQDREESFKLTEAALNSFVLQSPDPERFEKVPEASSTPKQPESYYNLDSTTDEIHRSLNVLNLDVTGSATCPLAPQTKKMLGRSHSTKSNHSLQIENDFLAPWSNERQRAEATYILSDTDNPESMWQTLSLEDESNMPSGPAPTFLTIDGDQGTHIQTTGAGHDSPYFSSIHSVSPSNAPKRHLFSTSKRSGIRRRRKSVKDHSKPQYQPPSSESPIPISPYTPTVPEFLSQLSDTPFNHAPVAFSPDPSPLASPTVRNPGMFDLGLRSKGDGASLEPGSLPKSFRSGPSRDSGETGPRAERAPLSRHGSGWSFNSDDTSLPSPSIHDKHHAGRRHKKKHHAFSSERSGLNPFPRTRLLRLIVDAIAHHVFTLSPQTGCLTWLNQRSLQYAGTPLSQLLHTSWTRLLHDDDRDRFWPLFKDSFDRGEMFNAQYRVRRFDGQYRWFLGRILPVRDCGGNIVHWFGTSTDIHDQKLAELQLNRQVELEVNEKKYRLLAEAIPQIVFTAAPQIGLTFANAKWFTYSGQVFEQACGLGFMDHVHPEDRAKCFLPTNISEGSGSPPLMSDTDPIFKHSTTPGTSTGQNPGEVSYQTELRLKRKDGKFRWFLVKCISVEVVEQGRKWFGTCTDINDHKLLEQKLKEAHDAAQKSTESKTRFLSNMSHEIRTPLVGITGMINFLITTDLTSEQLDYVHTVQQSADALLLVINDILDLSKVEAGMMKLEMEPFSVHTMIEGANELLSTLAIQKGLELGFLVENEVPEVVIGDRVRLRQVLINIIGNAIKFTTHGEVFSRCSVVPALPNGDPEVLTIKFEISDTGKGFDEAERAVMFKPFSQVDTSSTRKHGGTGLGLVLSKEFVELHGGEISCESIKGKGSTFSFTFKARLPSSNTPATALTPGDDIRVAGLVQNQSKGQHRAQQGNEGVTTKSIEPKWPERPALRHVTGLRLIPGEMCMATEDITKTRYIASKALEAATRSIEHGENMEEASLEVDQKGRSLSKSSVDSNSSGELCTVMTRTESILDDRRYLKVGQLTPSNPPLGEPPCVAVIAANLPNPALDMKLAIPAKVLENKALVAENKKAALLDQSTAGTSTSPLAPLAAALISNSGSAASSVSSLSSANSVSSSGSIRSQPSSASSTGSLDQLPEAGHPFQARFLVIADLTHARDTILHLVKQLVPKSVGLQIDVATDLKEGIEYLVGGRKSTNMTGPYNYVVINLASYMSVMDIFSVLQKDGVVVEPNVMTCVITTPIQRTSLMEAVKVEEASFEVTKTLNQSTSKVIPSRVEWVFKPLTKSKLYLAFADIMARQESSTKTQGTASDSSHAHDVNGKGQEGGGGRGYSGNGESGGSKVMLKRQTAQQVVMNQKEVFNQMKEDMKGKDIRILMAEDDLINQKVIRKYFQFVGAELVIANDGNECLEKFKSYPPGYFSLILCDLFMPGRDGYATTRAIREWEDEHLQKTDKQIPIVALSANVMANVTEQCLSSGFTSYLSKPVDFKKLSETLRQLLM
ncbi:MAG: hypothetical protein BYD32DRAFT_421594 [Podila humilis]|nr:MAG: hypothetical protein BYD32DRAFT_421594 [Podila humilis]